MDFSLTRSNLVSLAIASICLSLFAFFPTGENVWEDIACMIAFYIILPVLYVHFILKGSLQDLEIHLPVLKGEQILVLGGVITIGVLSALVVFFSPYDSEYVINITPLFSSFMSFTIYHVLFILPSILLVSFFSVTFVKSLELAPIYRLLFGGLTFCIILVSLFALPPITALFFIIPFFILWYFNIAHLYLLTLTVFLIILTYNTMIAKAILN